MKIDEIKSLFSRTIFFNDCRPVDDVLNDPAADAEHREWELPLKVVSFKGRDTLLLRYVSGELEFDVLEAIPLEDGEGGTHPANDESAFIAALPVAIPALLRRIRDLEKDNAEMKMAMDDIERERQEGPVL